MFPDNSSRQPQTILIIEDDGISRQILKVILEEEGFRCLCAENGQIGLDMWHETQPDVVLLDLEMPQIDGLEWLERVKLNESLTHSVILITAHESEEKLSACFALGIQTLLRKPVNRLELIGVVTRAFQFTEMARKLEQRNLLLESTFSQIKGGLMRVAGDTAVELISKDGIHILDANPESIIGRPLAQLLGKSFKPTQNVLTMVRKSGKPIYNRRLKWSLRSGRVIPVQLSAFPLLGPTPAGGWLLQFVDLQREEREQLQRFHGISFGRLVGSSTQMKAVYRLIDRIAPTMSSVLIQGESGTGKELVAREIHERSNRAQGPFHAVNCAAISPNLMESEFFGHEANAFTGAGKRKPGRLELAHRGTLFLDEVGELPLELQGKLLRVLEERAFERVGGTNTIRVDLRLLAATNRDLQEMVVAGTFRADLYYRLQVVPIRLPPLRERKEDLPLLVSWFIDELNRKMNCRVKHVSHDALNHMLHYHWPGNVRELLNTLECCFVMRRGDVIGLEDLPEFAEQPGATTPGEVAIATPTEPVFATPTSERELILQTLAKTNYKKGVAARLLGIHPTTLSRKLKKYGI
ncbi:Sigma-54-dependent Fis family transcriptional regulator [Sulfidibacter corallicola]|uniref:Sigma-54-dependent Fis family transcriptional regulator n=1 Tax=Sulfidibacter corallicola TaxID=2818388 RepID=A0A8A4TKW8_SULCO|nr:sigma-54 dependent transcriptional regulator [Sulfidibacter corallicola]QTD49521.1 sigma-54-dependent Fis family transcriptional regulator [Sulfidibacter corallicola]